MNGRRWLLIFLYTEDSLHFSSSLIFRDLVESGIEIARKFDFLGKSLDKNRKKSRRRKLKRRADCDWVFLGLLGLVGLKIWIDLYFGQVVYRFLFLLFYFSAVTRKGKVPSYRVSLWMKENYKKYKNKDYFRLGF